MPRERRDAPTTLLGVLVPNLLPTSGFFCESFLNFVRKTQRDVYYQRKCSKAPLVSVCNKNTFQNTVSGAIFSEVSDSKGGLFTRLPWLHAWQQANQRMQAHTSRKS